MYVDRHMLQVWPWRDEARFDAFATVAGVAEKLRHTGAYGAEIATLMTDTFEGFPRLVLTDEDGDGEADFYAYYDEMHHEDTLEFGTFFIEPGRTMPYWLLFNSGPGLALSDEGDPVLYWINYQFVDRNRDSKFDTYAVNNLDHDGDGQGSASDFLLLYDDDFDGGLDRGEHIVDGVAYDIPVVDNVFQTTRLGEETSDHKFRVGDPIGAWADHISADIHKALTEGDRPESAPLVPYLSDFSFPSVVDDQDDWQEYEIGDLRLLLPAGDEWSIENGDEHVQIVGGHEYDDAGMLLTADAMLVARDVMPNSIFGDWNVGELATRYREWEISNMQTEGVAYSLEDVQMGDTVIGDNTLYFLRHFQIFDPRLENGIKRARQELHLVFPPDFADTHVFFKLILMRYCVQARCDDGELDVSYLRQALSQISFE